MAIKKAAESQKDIVERVANQHSEFSAVFGTPASPQTLTVTCPHNPGEFVSVADMNRTSAKSGPLRVAAYIRVSTDSSDQENSYETQDKYFTELLSRNPEWISAGVYSDYGISGTSKQKRTGYKRILRHCKEGKIDRIVCKSISRFARNTSDFMTALDILHEAHVTILFEKEALDTADPTSDFILTTLAAIAQEESRSISSNIRWGIQKRYPKGQVRNYDIYGYRFAEGEDSMETLEDGYQIHRIEIVEEEAEIVRRIFHEVEDGMAYADIARRLNFEHIKAPNHGKTPKKVRGRSTVKEGIETGWTAGMISRIVSLERYCGDALLQKTYTPDFLTHETRKNNGEMPQYLVRDHHPAIIDRELFESVQTVRRINAVKFGNKEGKRTERAFSGRLACAECGRNYNVRNTNSYPIWFCPSTALN
ncbi:MAG: recombinase family protein, partial [Eubacteriales bacterium]|nr:recombinase family protein [Eubacteriales bacterium]